MGAMPVDVILFGMGSAAKRFLSLIDIRTCRIAAVSDFTTGQASREGFFGYRYVPAENLMEQPFQWLVIASESYTLISEHLIQAGIPKEKIIPFCFDPLDTDWELPLFLPVLEHLLVESGEGGEAESDCVIPDTLVARLRDRSRTYACGADGLKILGSATQWAEDSDAAGARSRTELVAIPSVGNLVDAVRRLRKHDEWEFLDIVFDKRPPGTAVCLAGKLPKYYLIWGRNRCLERRRDLYFYGTPSDSYCDLLERFAETFPVLDVRHDVDHDLRHAMKIANIERDVGIAATYYLLHPTEVMNYYGRIRDGRIEHSKMLTEYADRLMEMGHRIGLHHALVEFCARHHCVPADFLEAELSWLRQRDIPVNRMSAHGSKHGYQHGYIDYEIFKECHPSHHETWGEPGRVVCGVKLNSVSLEALGCREAYFEKYDYYFSDSHGGSVAGYRVDGQMGFEPQVRDRQRNTAKQVYPAFHCNVMKYPDEMPRTGGSCQLLIHPFWWRW